MKYYKQFLSVLLVFVLSFVLFLTPAAAETINMVTGKPIEKLTIENTEQQDMTTMSTRAAEPEPEGEYKVNIYAYMNHSSTVSFGQLNVYNGEMSSAHTSNAITIQSAYKNVNFRSKLTFVHTESKPILLEGESYTFTADNLYQAYGVNNSLTGYTDSLALYNCQLIYLDGTSSDYFKTGAKLTYNPTLTNYRISLDITPEKDVYKIIFWVTQDITVSSSLLGKSATYWMHYGSSPLDLSDSQWTPFSVTIEEQDNSSGLLSGIIGWVQNIFNKMGDTFSAITDGFSNITSSIGNWFTTLFGKIGDTFNAVVNGFSNIGTWFSQLPSKLWTAISDGLKSLFVPTTEFMTTYYTNWDTLLSSRFGALHEVAVKIVQFVGRIEVTDVTNSITLPVVNLESVGIPFQFGGNSVQIVPTGFSTLVEVCKKIISIACTFLFINGLRKRYDEIMGVEQ